MRATERCCRDNVLLKLNRFWMGTLAVSLACSALGGLQEREEEIKERSAAKQAAEEEKPSSSRSQSAAVSAFGSGTYPSSRSSSSGGFMADFWAWLVLAPFAYHPHDPGASMAGGDEDWAPEARSLFPPHFPGQATVPYFRADLNYQWADEVDALDGRIEAGYKYFVLIGRMTQYTDTTDFTLDVRQLYAGLRYGGMRPDTVPGSFEVHVGAGIAHHTGDIQDADSSGAFTFGLKYYPAEWIGFEFRPAWYRWEEIMIRDYDFSVSLGARYLQGRAGYRWIWDQGVVDLQSGPYAGVSLSF